MPPQVNVLTGRAGWHKRINKTSTSMARTAELTDKHSIDPTGVAVDKMQAAAKKLLFKKHTPVAEIPMCQFASATSGAPDKATTCRETHCQLSIVNGT